MDQCSLNDKHQHLSKMKLSMMQHLGHNANEPRRGEELTGVVAPIGGH